MTPDISRSLQGRDAVLIAAFSGRALAESARRAGYMPLVADLFGDTDTQKAAFASRRVAGNLRAGLDLADLSEKLEELAACSPSAPVGLVYGAGFEHDSAALASLQKNWRVLGTAPETVARIKDPIALRDILRDHAIPHPEIRLDPPCEGDWLVKVAGGAGGGHIRRLSASPSETDDDRARIYYQREVRGDSISALFLGAGGMVRLIGFSRQWVHPSAVAPFRFGGACRLLGAPAELQATLAAIVARIEPLFRAVKLTGLFSVDFLIGEQVWWLLDINPRPGATLDIFDIEDCSLFHHHMNAARGRLPGAAIAPRQAAAVSILYAEGSRLRVPKTVGFPEWIKDRPKPGTVVEAGDPICTVVAAAASSGEALELCGERLRRAEGIFNERQSTRKQRHDGGNLRLHTG